MSKEEKIAKKQLRTFTVFKINASGEQLLKLWSLGTTNAKDALDAMLNKGKIEIREENLEGITRKIEYDNAAFFPVSKDISLFDILSYRLSGLSCYLASRNIYRNIVKVLSKV